MRNPLTLLHEQRRRWFAARLMSNRRAVEATLRGVIAAWLSDDAVTSDSNVTAIPNHVDRGTYDLTTSGVAANQPTFVNGNANGHGTIEFDGVDDFLKVDAVGGEIEDNVFTIYVVLNNLDGIGDGWQYIFQLRSSTGTGELYLWMEEQSEDVTRFETGNYSTTNNKKWLAKNYPASVDMSVIVLRADGTGNARLGVNEHTSSTSSAWLPSGAIDYHGLTHIGRVGQYSGGYLHSNVASIAICKQYHSDAEVTSNIARLRSQYIRTRQGWHYDGTAYTTVTNDDALDVIDSFSIGGMVKLNSLMHTYGWLLSLGNLAATPSLNIFFNDDGRIKTTVRSNNETLSVRSSSTIPGRSTDWCHVLLVYDASESVLVLYVNGVNVAENLSVNFDAFTFGGGTRLGDSNNVPLAKFDGTLSRWAKFDEALDATDRSFLAAGGDPDKLPSKTNPAWYIEMPAAEGDITAPFDATGTNHEVEHTNVSGTTV